MMRYDEEVMWMPENEKIFEEVAELVSRKETKKEQDAFLHKILFGMK